MKYKPELGFFRNLERAFSELTKTNNRMFNAEHDAIQMDARVIANEDVINALLGVNRFE